METDKLIKNLVLEAHPVKRLPSPWVRFLRWFLISLFCLSVGISIHGLRHDLGTKLSETSFIIQSIIILILSLSSAVSAFVLSVPGLEKSRWTKRIPLITGLVWIIFLVFNFIQNSSTTNFGLGFTCVRDMILLGFLPALVLFLMILKAAPVKLGWTGFLIFMAAAGFASFGLQFTCSNDDSLHILAWHVLPVVLIGTMGIILGKRFLIWFKNT